MQGHVYHWKHGYIPLDHYAALVKAHGSHKGAAKYLNESNGHHGTESHKLSGHADKVSGTDQYGRSTSYEGHSVASSRATQGGKSGVVHSMHNGSDRSGLDASSRATVFVPDVNQKAGEAQAKSMSPAELKAQNQGDFRAGEKVAVKAAGGIRIASIREVAPDGRLVLHIPGHGTITRSAEDLSRKMSTATKAAEERRINGDWRKTPTPRLRSALQSSAFSAGQKAAMKAELDRRGG